MSPLIVILMLLLIYAPMLWVKFTFWQYKHDLDEIPGTGAEFATHLIQRFQLEDVQVMEVGANMDHYNPNEKTVCLAPNNFHGRSLTAIAVAAHEVGHAIQFARNDPTCRLFSKYYPLARSLQRIGIGLISLPFFSLLFSAPRLSGIALLLVILVMVCSAVVHLIILPQEWDASFHKALPILEEGEYVNAKDLPKIRIILRAAALTYFAGALADVIRCWRWGGLFRGLRF